MQSQQFLFLFVAQLLCGADLHMTVNDHLLVSFPPTEGSTLVRYQCLMGTSQPVGEVLLSLDQSNSDLVAIGEKQSESQLYFIVFGYIGRNVYDAYYMTKVTVNCNNRSDLSQITVLFDNRTFYEALWSVVDVSPDGRFALSCTDRALLIFDLNTLKNSSYEMDWPAKFRPRGIKISDRHVFITGYSEINNNLRMLYLLTIKLTSTGHYNIIRHDTWTWEANGSLPPSISFLSVTSDSIPRLLLTATSPSVVHLLTVNESMHLHHVSSNKGLVASSVAWIDQGEKAVVLTRYSLSQPSELRVFEMGHGVKFDSTTVPSAQYLMRQQLYPHKISFNIEMAKPSPRNSGIYLENEQGKIFLLPRSQPGYYPVENSSLKDGWIFPFVGNSAQCPTRTYKNESGFWSCILCQPSANSSNIASASPTCPQCTKKEYCPGEFVTSLDHFKDITQHVAYPESPEIDVFDDIVLYHMFRTDCGWSSPFSLTMIALSVIIAFSILLFLTKLSKRVQKKRQHLLSFCRHLDLIGQGELWFGGLLSIAVLFLAAFAAQLSHNYQQQYPIEKHQDHSSAENPCQVRDLLNSQFQTSLQFLSTLSGEHEQIFDLLDSQVFSISLEFIRAQFHCEQLWLEYAEKKTSLPFSCKQDNRVLYVLATLPAHKMSLKVSVYGKRTTGFVRMGLRANEIRVATNTARKLNFSKRFNSSQNQSVSPGALVELDLTKIINITEGLTESDKTTISGLWLPTFTFDTDRMFGDIDTTLDTGVDSSSTSQPLSTLLSISIRETTFFVKNKQKPIARRSEIIFHTILVVGGCIDLLAMAFLLLKLWLIPLLMFVLKKLLHPSNWLYRLIFEEDELEPEQHVSADVQRLEREVNGLKMQLQERNDTMQAFMRHFAS